jgi:hypothetical protein
MKINQTYKSFFILLLVVGSFFFISKTIAVSTPYRAGETRDPECAPGDLFCTVNLDKDLYKENASETATNTTSGTNSIAIGSGNTASGISSIAIGHEYDGDPGAEASGDYTVAIGQGSVASALQSSALGVSAVAEGQYSTAVGYLSYALGGQSIAIGPGTIAASFREISLGSYPTDYTPTSTTAWNEGDRLLNVGGGSSSVDRYDAFTIMKGGRVGIGTNRPFYSLDISNLTDALALPKGADADRPATLKAGLLRFNTDGGSLEYSDGVTWIPLTSSSSLKLITENYVNRADLPNPTGNESIAMGIGTSAATYGESSLGMYPRTSTGSKTLVDTADILFTVGNGTSSVKSNAFIINKGGTIGLGDITKADLTSAEASNAFMTTETGGYLKIDGTWVSASDRSLKTNIKDISYGLETIKKIQPRSFEYIKTGEPSIGFIAQEMETVVPEIVSDGGMGTKGISYGQLTAVLVKAVQELSDRVEELESDAGITPAKVEEVKEVPVEETPAPVEETPAEETLAETLPASLIASSNEINLTNILLMLAIGLLLINLAIQVKKNN